jgi:hypothetical protein
MLGRRYRNSVTEEGGRNTGRTWTQDGKRRQNESDTSLFAKGGVHLKLPS